MARKKPTTSTLGELQITPPSSPVYGLGDDAPTAAPAGPKRATPGRANTCGSSSPKATVRLCLEHTGRGEKTYFGNAQDVCKFARGLGTAAEENFHVLHLDVRHKLIDVDHVGKGSSTGVEVHPREVFKSALLNNAVSLILIHNHPSGATDPSRQDIELTQRLKQVGELHGIAVLDHVIVGDVGCTSLVDRGLMSGLVGYGHDLDTKEGWDAEVKRERRRKAKKA